MRSECMASMTAVSRACLESTEGSCLRTWGQGIAFLLFPSRRTQPAKLRYGWNSHYNRCVPKSVAMKPCCPFFFSTPKACFKLDYGTPTEIKKLVVFFPINL